MAVNPYFTFADPALQRAVSDEAIAQSQLAAVQEQARTASRERMSRDREARAIRQSEIERSERLQQQQDRQFQQSLAQRDRELATNADLYKTQQSDYRTALDLKEKNAIELEKFNGLKALFRDTNSIPSPLEVQAELQGMHPERASILKSLADNTRQLAQDAWNQGELLRTKWANRIASIDPKKGETLDGILKEFNSNKDSQVILFDGTGFVNRYKRPRQDALFGPEPQPATAPAVGAAPGVRTIQDVIKSPAAQEPYEVPFLRAAMLPAANTTISELIRGISQPRMPVAPAPAGPSVPVTASALQAPTPAAPATTGGMLDYNQDFNQVQQLIRQAQAAPPVGQLSPVNMPYEGSAFRVTAPPVAPVTPAFIPLDERFDAAPGGFTGGQRIINRGLRLTENIWDAAQRRFEEARKTYPNAILRERPDGFYIEVNPAPPTPVGPLSPINMPYSRSALNPAPLGNEGVLYPLEYR